MMFLLANGRNFEMVTNSTIFSTVGLVIFGYAVFEKGFSGWWFLAYAGIILLYYSIIKNINMDKAKQEWIKKHSNPDT